MPSLSFFLSSYHFDLVGLLVVLALLVPYILGLRVLYLKEISWPLLRTAGYMLFGVGSYAWATFGFLGVYSAHLRWAFSTRIVLMLLVVPLLISTGKPLELAQAALSEAGASRLNKFLESWLVRLISNAVFAPLFVLVFFMFFVSPISATWRDSPAIQALITCLVPLIGLLMVLPMVTSHKPKSSLFMAAEFIIAFVELLLDAIPGVVLSISNTVLDGVSRVSVASAAWSGSALADQHFSGNLLWMIAEGADLPILIMLMMRWRRSDRAEARKADELTDEEYEILVQQHLRVGRSDG